jgi:hypothetical protein
LEGKENRGVVADDARAFTIVGGILWCVMESIGELATLVCLMHESSLMGENLMKLILTYNSSRLLAPSHISLLVSSIQHWDLRLLSHMGIVTQSLLHQKFLQQPS